MLKFRILQREHARKIGLNPHILNTSSTLVGVCMTVISLVKIIEVQSRINSRLDEVMAVDAVGFMSAALFSYLSLRAESRRPGRAAQLEQLADLLFIASLVGMALTSVLFAFEFI